MTTRWSGLRNCAAVAGLCLLAAACGSVPVPAPTPTPTAVVSTPIMSPSPSLSPAATPSYTWPPTTACGLERWAVKTGTDPDASKVSLNFTTPATISELDSIPPPVSLPPDARVAPVENTVFVVHATLTEFKLEGDSDYHLVLVEGTAHMIAEIPDPACVGRSSPFLPGIETARSQFDAHFYHPSSQFFTHVSVPVIVTGVGFFDFNHGQSGVAPNAIELHPVIRLVFSK